MPTPSHRHGTELDLDGPVTMIALERPNQIDIEMRNEYETCRRPAAEPQ